MISRAKAILLALLVLASLGMGGLLWHLINSAHQRRLAVQDSAPTQAPQVAPSEKATLIVANDDENSLRGQVYALPLPADPGGRARAVLGKLLDLYAAPDSTHPVPGGAASIGQVFLLPVPKGSRTEGALPEQIGTEGDPEMAVVNLKGSFVATHPSGLETETLTVLSICGTLQANLPRVTEVRFLVDGQIRPSLAGHADLTRIYLTSDAVPAEMSRP